MDDFETLQFNGLTPSLLSNRLGLSPDTLKRLFAKIQVAENGCWVWTGAKVKGYGVVKIRAIRKTSFIQVHRLTYQLLNGEIDSMVLLHHKVESGCLGPGCCHPWHLDRTTHGAHPDARPALLRSRQTCAAGHPYTFESLKINKDGSRHCRICDKIKHQEARDAARGDRPKWKKGPALRKTHCLRGHALEGDNLYWYDSPWGKQSRCRACDVARRAERKLKP